VVFGIVLYVVDRVASSRRHLGDLGVRDGLLLGIAQALALQPGVSRSGVTMTAARLLTFDRETAARFSVLLSLPVIAGAAIYKGLDTAGDGIPAGLAGPFFAGGRARSGKACPNEISGPIARPSTSITTTFSPASRFWPAAAVTRVSHPSWSRNGT